MSVALLVMWMWAAQGCPSQMWIAKTDGSYKCWEFKAADPVDVPAVQEDYIQTRKGQSCTSGNNLNWCVAAEDIHGLRWTCADKSRVLLTSEDGKRWCHKVQQ